jgi:zinc transport system permease protein
METVLQWVVNLLAHMLPFTWAEPEFMRRALVAVVLVCPLCATMGVLVVNRQMAFFSEAIAHSAFTGIAIGIILGMGSPVPAMVGFCLLVGLGIANIRERSLLAVDTVIGVFFATAVAIGLVIISSRQGLARQLPVFLFGDILTVNTAEIIGLVALALLTVVFLWFAFNPLMFSSISPEMAATCGFPLRFYEYCFAALLSLIVALSIRVVGILLISAMLIVPAAAARNVSRTVRLHFWMSGIFSLFSGILGLVGSYYFNTATGASIILIASILFFVTFTVKLLARR